jgi:hypothetical protein
MEILTLEQSDYYKACIFRTRINKKLFFEALPDLFTLKEALSVGEKFHMKARTVSEVLSGCMPYLIMQPAYGLYEKIKVSSNVKSDGPLDVPETRRMKKTNRMHEIKFYTQEEINEMVSLIKDPTVNMHNVCLKLAKKHGRSHNAIKVKMYQLRRKLETGQQLKRIVTIEPKKNVKEKLNFQPEPIVEQKPADIGVDVPHGMTFEGKPKRITLHSDHFRIYF